MDTKVNGRTEDRRTDGWTDGGHDTIRPVFDRRIIKVPSFVKISQRVPELLSGHDFHSEVFKGE